MQAKHPSDVIGNWGPYQRTIVILVLISYTIAPFSNITIPLFAPKLNFTCHHVDMMTGRLVSLPNTCEYKDNDGMTIACSNFTYDHSFYKRTMVEEFDLVCSRSWYPSFSQSLHQIGYAVSGLALGYLSDRRGRLFAAKTAIILEIIAGFSQAFAPSIYLFWVARFFIGIAAYGRFLSCYVMLTEWIGPKMRANAIVISDFGWNIGSAWLVAFYYLVPDYKIVQATGNLAEILVFIMIAIFANESPRWLLTNSRFDEASTLLTKAAKAKGKLHDDEIERRITSLKDHTERELSHEENVEKQSIFDVWKEPVLFKISLILYFSWFGQALSGYGYYFMTEMLGGNFFLNLVIFQAFDIVFYFFVLAVFDRIPRVKAFTWGLALEVIGFACVLVTAFSNDMLWYRIAGSVVYRFGAALAWQAMYLYTAETFPTTMRQASMGTCSLFARVGSVISPFVKELTNHTHLSVSITVFLIICSVNLLLIVMLPDTSKLQVADTIGQKKRQVDERGGIRSLSTVSAISFDY
jgi:MFS family permease